MSACHHCGAPVERTAAKCRFCGVEREVDVSKYASKALAALNAPYVDQGGERVSFLPVVRGHGRVAFG